MLQACSKPSLSKPNANQGLLYSLRTAVRSNCVRPRHGTQAAVTTAVATARRSPQAIAEGFGYASCASATRHDAAHQAAKQQAAVQQQDNNQHEQQLTSIQPTAAHSATVAHAVLKPSAVRRCRNVHTVCSMLYHNHSSVSPRFWVTALVHLSHLVAKEGQQVPADNWKKLRECLKYLVTEQQQQQQQQRQVDERVEQHQQRQVDERGRQQQQQERAVRDQTLHQHTFVGEQQQQQQHPQPDPTPLAAALSQPPIAQFTPSDIATMLWALAKCKAHLPSALAKQFWPVVLQQLSHSSSSSSSSSGSTSSSGCLMPRDMALLAWSLLQLQVPMPAGWFQGLLDAQAAALTGYPTASLLILLHATARLGLTVSTDSAAALLSALAPRLRRMHITDLSQVLWSLGVLQLRPSTEFMAAAMAASKRQLSGASCSEISALLVGVARLGYLPPGPWLLELFDQLYWTADQLQLQQLSGIIWAFGKLRLVAVPQELLERLLKFAHVQLQLQPQLAAAAAAAAEAQEHDEEASSSSNDGSSRSSKEQYVLAKQIYTLLTGLAGLHKQLPAQTIIQSNIGHAWIAAVLAGQGSMSKVHIPACLYAAALLKIRLPSYQDCARAQAGSEAARTLSGPQPGTQPGTQDPYQDFVRPHAGSQAVRTPTGPQPGTQDGSGLGQAVIARLSGLRPRLSHTGLALGFWGAVGLGCRPDKTWLEEWFTESRNLMSIAAAAEVNMLLQGCVALRYVPDKKWLIDAYARLDKLLLLSRPGSSSSGGGGGTTGSSSSSDGGGSSSSSSVGLSGSSMAATLKYLLALQEIHLSQQRQQQQQQWVQVPPQLLVRLSARMEYLERHRAASPTAVQVFHRYKAQLLGGQQQQRQQWQQQPAQPDCYSSRV